jgi:hypothetical protein
LGIARHGRVAPSIPTLLQLPEEPQGITVPGVPAFEEIGVIGRENTAAAISTALALRQRLRAEVAIDGILANPQLLGDGPPGPPLLVQAPDPLVERPPLCLALVGQFPGRARRRWGWHRHGHRAVGSRHRCLVKGRIDRLKGVAMSVKHLVEGFGEVLQQVKAIGHLDGVGGALSGPIRIGSGPIPSEHADAGMGLQPEGEGLGLTIGQEGERPPPFEIDQPSPLGLALAIRPIVDTEHVRRGHIGEGQMTQQV